MSLDQVSYPKSCPQPAALLNQLLPSAGIQPFIVQEGVARAVSDLLHGISQQHSMEDCGRACMNYQGPAACMAWAYSSPSNSTPGTCWLKAMPDGPICTATSLVSAFLPGEVSAAFQSFALLLKARSLLRVECTKPPVEHQQTLTNKDGHNTMVELSLDKLMEADHPQTAFLQGCLLTSWCTMHPTPIKL
jgi:hypothetical protein